MKRGVALKSRELLLHPSESVAGGCRGIEKSFSMIAPGRLPRLESRPRLFKKGKFRRDFPSRVFHFRVLKCQPSRLRSHLRKFRRQFRLRSCHHRGQDWQPGRFRSRLRRFRRYFHPRLLLPHVQVWQPGRFWPQKRRFRCRDYRFRRHFRLPFCQRGSSGVKGAVPAASATFLFIMPPGSAIVALQHQHAQRRGVELIASNQGRRPLPVFIGVLVAKQWVASSKSYSQYTIR